jgi:hypothetical protein
MEKPWYKHLKPETRIFCHICNEYKFYRRPTLFADYQPSREQVYQENCAPCRRCGKYSEDKCTRVHICPECHYTECRECLDRLKAELQWTYKHERDYDERKQIVQDKLREAVELLGRKQTANDSWGAHTMTRVVECYKKQLNEQEDHAARNLERRGDLQSMLS